MTDRVYLKVDSNGYCERVIGSIRRECLDHVIVLSDGHLRRVLKEYLDYYHESRTHLGLGRMRQSRGPSRPRTWDPWRVSRSSAGCITATIAKRPSYCRSDLTGRSGSVCLIAAPNGKSL